VDNVDKNPGEEIVLKGAEIAVVGGKTILDRSSLDSITSRFTVVDNFKDKKIVVFKYKAKKRYRIKTGHRQLQTILEVAEISSPELNFDIEAAGEVKIEEKEKEKEKAAEIVKEKKISTEPKKAAIKKVATVKGKPASGIKPTTKVTSGKTVKKKVDKMKITSQKPGSKKQAGKKK